MKITNENVYIDWVDSDVLPGTRVHEVTSLKTRTLTEFRLTYKNSLKIGVSSEVDEKLAESEYQTKYSLDDELEFEAWLDETFEREIENTKETEFTVPEGSRLGSILFKVDFVFGAEYLPVTVGHLVVFLSPELASNYFHQYHMSSGFQQVANLLNPQDCPLLAEGEGKPKKPYLFLPPKGRTCHHVQFRKQHLDSCHIDNKYCLDLPGDEFVVCHHHNFRWIGGKQCNCTHVDNKNVMRIKARDLNEAYG